MTVTQKVPVEAGSPIPSPVPSLASTTLGMERGATVGPYNMYRASYPIASTVGTKYDVASGSFSDAFKDAADLGNTCRAMGSKGVHRLKKVKNGNRKIGSLS
jgi:hypothetical protein